MGKVFPVRERLFTLFFGLGQTRVLVGKTGEAWLAGQAAIEGALPLRRLLRKYAYPQTLRLYVRF